MDQILKTSRATKQQNNGLHANATKLPRITRLLAKEKRTELFLLLSTFDKEKEQGLKCLGRSSFRCALLGEYRIYREPAQRIRFSHAGVSVEP